MLMILIRDGFIYFGVVFAAFLFNLLVWASAPVRSQIRRSHVSLTFVSVVFGPLATRLRVVDSYNSTLTVDAFYG